MDGLDLFCAGHGTPGGVGLTTKLTHDCRAYDARPRQDDRRGSHCVQRLAANRVMEVSISGGSPTTRRLFSALHHWLQIQRWPRHPRFLGLAGRARSSVLERTPRAGCCEMAGSGKAFAPSR